MSLSFYTCIVDQIISNCYSFACLLFCFFFYHCTGLLFFLDFFFEMWLAFLGTQTLCKYKQFLPSVPLYLFLSICYFLIKSSRHCFSFACLFVSFSSFLSPYWFFFWIFLLEFFGNVVGFPGYTDTVQVQAVSSVGPSQSATVTFATLANGAVITPPVAPVFGIFF